MKEKETLNENLGEVSENISAALEIFPGMTVEEMKAMFFDDNALIEAPKKVWQLNSKGYRYYFCYDEEGLPNFYPSVTTILSKTLPKSSFLMKWIAEKGYEEAERYKEERAYYGTFMHIAFEELLINRRYDLDTLKDRLKTYIEDNHLPSNFIYYADDFKKDVLAFARFVLDYDVKPFAIEISLVHEQLNYAGTIDLPCSMLEKQGGDKRINAIIDFKSGRKNFYEEAEIQLHFYKEMWNYNFPNLEITKVFNFSPKDWRKKPTYNLKDQTNSVNANKMPYLLGLAAIEDDKKENVFTNVSGIIDLDNDVDFSNNVISLSLSEIISKKDDNINCPDEKISFSEEEIEQQQKESEIKPKRTPKRNKKDESKESIGESKESVLNGSKMANDEISDLLENDIEL